MSREAIVLLKNQYKELYGRNARGQHANNVAWLQSNINEKLKTRVGPRGPRGAIGKTGRKGAKGDRGAKGEDGEDGLSFLFQQTDPVEEVEQKRERNPTKRIEQQIIKSQSAPHIQSKYKEVLALLLQAKNMKSSLAGIGSKIAIAVEDFHVKQSDAETVHEEIKSLAVGNNLAQDYISIQVALQKPLRFSN
eukprot:SAG11_NODE_6233_length_1356_cov_10.299920_1_plen_192_part_00